MKKQFLLSMLLPAFFALNAQTGAKKYVLLEHFTNSKCSICASKNPGFYTLIAQAQNAAEIHHIAIHPPYPYNTCEFYQANTPENNAWAALYGISGTPRVAVNGHLLNPGSQLLRQDTLNHYLQQSSPLYVKVTESGLGSSRTADVELRVLGVLPQGNYKLYVALAEKTVNKTTPNNETVHHDVFRDMLTAVEGQAISLPAPGESIHFQFPYSMQSNWNASEIYALAFVKESIQGLVLNSGTKFDPLLSEVQSPATNTLLLSPNPAADQTLVQLSDDQVVQAALFSSGGSRVWAEQITPGAEVRIPLNGLPKGLYVVKITGEKNLYSTILVKY